MTDAQYHTPLPQSAGFPESANGTAMCALTLIYHEDFEPAINGILQRAMSIVRYTKLRDVVGARADTLDNADIAQVGSRHMIVILAEREIINTLLIQLRELRQKKGTGLRGFVTPVEEVI